MEVTKAYVTVHAVFSQSGNVEPEKIVWKDGREYECKALDIRRAASLKAGGTGIRYKVQIGVQETYIWREDDRWFVEEKVKC